MKRLFKLFILVLILFGAYQFIESENKSFSDVGNDLKTGAQQLIEKLTTILTNEQTVEQQTEQQVDPVVIENQLQTVATVQSEYNRLWQVSHQNYENFTLTFNDETGGYVAGNGRQLFKATIGQTTMNDVKALYGITLTSIQKNNVMYEFSTSAMKEELVYELDGYYVTFFFDVHNSYKLRAIQYIAKETELQKPGFHQVASTNLRDGFERLMVQLMNQSRVEAGLKPLIYDEKLKAVTRAHSQDMIDHNYFSHTGSDGSDVQQRMVTGGYTNEKLYAENLAYGQYSAIFAHEGLMNSLGHRENILREEATHVGVGVAFDRDNVPYFTINFYTPF